MNPELWALVKELYRAARKLPPAEREAYLRSACAGDEELYREAKRLLELPDAPEGFLEPPEAVSLSGSPRSDVGSRLGEFELHEELGRGGMGIVFRATQPDLGRVVAVKALPPSLSRSARDVERFQREGRAVARLNHPSIVSIHTVGTDRDTPYFAMEYIEGRSLAEELRILRGEGAAGEEPVLPPYRSRAYVPCVVELCIRVCDALQYAHDRGVVHRDIKPRNLLLDRESRPHVVDFGLARVEELGSISRSGDMLGTLYYMSPEQARVLTTPVDHRTDIYSIGVVLYELLTLSRPFDGETSQEVLHRLGWEDPVPIRERNPSIARDLEIVCEGAIAKQPNRRYSTAGELGADLRRFLEHRSIHRRPPSPAERARVWARRHWRPLVSTGVAVAAIVLGAWGQQVLEASGERQRAREELEVALRDFESLPSGTIVAAADHARELRDRSALGPQEERLLEQLEARCEARVDSLRAEGRTALSELLEKAPRTDVRTSDFGREPRLVDAVEALTGAALLGGGVDEELIDELVRLSTVTVSIDVSAPESAAGAQAFARRIDPFSERLGEPRLLGEPPLEVHLAEGHWLLVVDRPGFGFAELRRWFPERGKTYEVRATLRPWTTEQNRVPEGMVRIEPATCRILSLGAGLPEMEVEVRPFLIDARPVTNGQYAEFLAEEGGARPLIWRRSAGRPADWDERPVTEVAIADARRYAEWAGKRLPTRAEWELAARGTERHRYPWGDELDERIELFNLGAPDYLDTDRDPADPDARFVSWYLANVRPAAELPPDCRGPNGLDELLGNVWEWTESLRVERGLDGLVLRPRLYYRVGSSCASPLTQARLGFDNVIWGDGPPMIDTGFRCAKSVSPLATDRPR